MAPPLPDRNVTMARAIQMIEAGYSLRGIAAVAGMPSRQTLHRWMAGCETWRRQADAARAGMRAGRRAEAAGRDFDAGRAEAFLAQVRLGFAVRDLVRGAGRGAVWLNRERLARWTTGRPDFAAALGAAVACGRRVRRGMGTRRVGFDPAVADKVVVRLAGGRRWAELWADADLPGRHVLARWRREDAGFDRVVRTAVLAGHRQRTRARALARRLAPDAGRVGGGLGAVRETILGRIAAGESLRGLGGQPGLPHRVTLYRWVREDRAFAEAVADACHQREIGLQEMAVAIAETATPATMPAVMRAMGAVRRRQGQLRPWPGTRRRPAGSPRGSPENGRADVVKPLARSSFGRQTRRDTMRRTIATTPGRLAAATPLSPGAAG